MPYTVKDSHGRTFSKLRLSLTDKCNFACTYCVDDKTPPQSFQKDLSKEKIIEAVKSINKVSPLSQIRLTGGEPLLHKEFDEIALALSKLNIKDIAITTNGHYLEKKLPILKECNINKINISIDAVDSKQFSEITKKDSFKKVDHALSSAIDQGFDIKVNAVIMKGINHQEVVPLLDYCNKKGATLRYIELMKMGHLFNNHTSLFYSENDILKDISKYYKTSPLPRTDSSTAKYWKLGNGKRFGIISNESSPFCSDCNRLRMDSKGNIYGCLSSPENININSISNNKEMEYSLNKLLLLKKDKFTGSTNTMKNIGG